MTTTINTCIEHNDVLIRPQCRDHAAQLYVDTETLCEALETYIGAGLDRGEAVVIAINMHIERLRQRLTDSGRNAAALLESGQLVCIDAESCLTRIMHGREPDRQSFDSIIGEIVNTALARFPGLCVYGELVNPLWQQDNRPAAHQLEQWWSHLIQRHGFTLLCGYRVNVFDDQHLSGLDTICQTHSHLIPANNGEDFDQALDAALQEVFQNGDVQGVRQELAERSRRSVKMPAAHAALLTLHDLLPSLGHQVSLRAQHHYYQNGRQT